MITLFYVARNFCSEIWIKFQVFWSRIHLNLTFQRFTSKPCIPPLITFSFHNFIDFEYLDPPMANISILFANLIIAPDFISIKLHYPKFCFFFFVVLFCLFPFKRSIFLIFLDESLIESCKVCLFLLFALLIFLIHG